MVSGAGQPLEAERGFCTGVLRRLLPKAVWCHGERGKTRKEEKKPKELGEVRRNTKQPEGAWGPLLLFLFLLYHLLRHLHLVFLAESSPGCRLSMYVPCMYVYTYKHRNKLPLFSLFLRLLCSTLHSIFLYPASIVFLVFSFLHNLAYQASSTKRLSICHSTITTRASSSTN